MIQSLFLLSSTGQILIERHFRGVVTSRTVCDTFWQLASISLNHHGGVSSTSSIVLLYQQGDGGTGGAMKPLYDTVPPVLELPVSDQGTLYVISVLRDGLSYLAVCPAEVSPLLVIEFLHRIADTFRIYFGIPADESAIKDNFSTVYQLLEEMVDYGYPFTTEPNALLAMIRPPTVISKLLSFSQSTTGMSSTIISDELPSGTVSNKPWRTAGVSYTQNEIYMDIMEQVDAIMDGKTGSFISCDVSGSVQCQSHLSGIPDLLLTFTDPSIMDDVSFHPCVRYSRYEKDSVVSFVPPDGNFELMKYRIRPEQVKYNFKTSPIYCTTQWTFNDTAHDSSTNATTTTSTTPGGNGSSDNNNNNTEHIGRLMVQVGVTAHNNSLIYSSSATNKSTVEDVFVTIPFPKSITHNVTDFRVNIGTVLYDEAAKIARWNLGPKIDATLKPSFACRFIISLNHTDTNTTGGTSSSSGGVPIGTTSSQQIKPITPSTSTTASSLLLNGTGGGTRARRGCRINSRYRQSRDNIIKKNSWWSPPTLSLGWKIPLASVSGLSVSGLSVTGESYRPYKGVRNITKSGLFQVRP